MSDSQPVRILLLAGHPVVCAGLRRILESERVFVVGECGQTADAMASMAREQVDVVVIDTDSADVSITAVATLAEASRGRILVFSAACDPGFCSRALELGASGVINKDQSPELLVRAVLKVHEGEVWLDRSKMAAVLAAARRRARDPEVTKIGTLTKREREIVALVGHGLKNGPIGERLFISDATVRNHLTSILSKLGLSDRFELAVFAFRHGLVGDGAIPAQSGFPSSAEQKTAGGRLGVPAPWGDGRR